FRLGLVAMFVDPSLGRSQVERCSALVRPRGFVGTWRAHVLSWASRPVRAIPIRRRVWGVGFGWASREPGKTGDALQAPPEAPALITFTTGSTGEPKAAVRTHGFLLAQHRVVSETLGLRPGEVDLTTLPMFVLANLASGVTSVIPDADLRRPGSIRT